MNLIRHPEARDPNLRRTLAEVQREVQNSLKKLEVLKPRITKRHERHFQSTKDRESWQENKYSQQDDGRSTLSTSEALDPAIAGRPQPLAAAENKDLAVKLAQKELRRRAAARLGQYLDEGSLVQSQQDPYVTRRNVQYGRTDQDDLAKRLQEIRARVEQDQSYLRGTRPSQSKPSGQTASARPESNSSPAYRYPTVPGQSTFNIAETLPPIPKKEILEPHISQPPSVPAKVPEKILLTPAGPPVPSKISPSTLSLSPEPSPSPTDLQPSTFTFKPSSYLENGTPLRTIFISPDLRRHFLEIAGPNTDRNLETCGILCGSLISNAFFISKLLIPDQESTPDTCEMINEAAVFEYCDSQEDLMVLGWIHTHPSQTCFMSSRDLHTQSGYQVMLAESIAIVCAPSKKPDWGVFRLTDPPGLKTVLGCTQKGLFHPHGEMDIYTDALRPGHVFEAKGLEFETVDLRKG